MKQLTSQGVGTNTRQAETFSINDERRLWEGGVFGLSTGQQLLHTVFYYCGKFFGLRLSEQTDLTYKKIKQGFDSHNRRYIEYHGKKEKKKTAGRFESSESRVQECKALRSG